jgi:hypothetical protein
MPAKRAVRSWFLPLLLESGLVGPESQQSSWRVLEAIQTIGGTSSNSLPCVCEACWSALGVSLVGNSPQNSLAMETIYFHMIFLKYCELLSTSVVGGRNQPVLISL